MNKKESDTAIVELLNNTLYRGQTSILKNISWKINQGEHWALIGPNGSGKTTLLKIVSGSLWPSSGEVKVLGHKFGKVDLRELRKKIGMVASYLTEQIPAHQKALAAVISGKYSSFGIYQKVLDKDKIKAIQLLKFLRCLHIKGMEFQHISQGEKQKVLIARALIAEPLILILDEPCSALDLKSRKDVLSSVSKICRENNATVIYVTHHFDEIVPEIKNIFMIKKGRNFMQGKAKDILNISNIKRLMA